MKGFFYPAPTLADLGGERLVAGFSTRSGGDDEAALAAAAGFDLSLFFMVTQVHGNTVVRVRSGDVPERIRPVEADALVTDVPGISLGVRTADCVPVLLVAPGGRGVAAAHAGWRGLVAGVIEAAASELSALAGVGAEALAAAIGPAIGSCCFEVGDDVARTIAAAAGTDEVVSRPAGAPRPFVDLRLAATLRARDLGIAEERLEVVGPCTRCTPEKLHSYRRDGLRGGRQIGFVSLLPR